MGKFCSQKCQFQAQRNGVYIKCSACKKLIYRTPRHFKHSKSGKFFCDKSCLAIQNITNYLLFGHNTFVFPKFLMVNESDFNDESQLSPKTKARLQKLLSNFTVFVKKISSERIDL